MKQVTINEAESQLSDLIRAIASGAESKIMIGQDGGPAARLFPVETARPHVIRLGVAKGLFTVPDDGDNDAIARMFYGDAA